MISNKSMENGKPSEHEERLNELFRAYREACPDPEPSAAFMPQIWARIEAREVSTNWFGSVAKALVTAALAASVILGMMLSSMNQSNAYFNDTFVEAVSAERASALEPLQLDRISDSEPW